MSTRRPSRRVPRFHVCIHDATPAYAHETEVMLRGLGPLIGRRLSCGVVPDWHGRWPLAAHPDYCRMVQEGAGELLLHGYCHRRQRGLGPIAAFAGRCDEMNGLAVEDTRRTIARGQQVFTEVFGAAARGFLAPAWQPGHVRPGKGFGLDHVLGFLSLASCTGTKMPLATSTWDCGRWGWLGHVGQGVGWLLQTMGSRVPVLAVHPRDLKRGFWPAILRLTEALLERGYEPATLAQLIEASDADRAA